MSDTRTSGRRTAIACLALCGAAERNQVWFGTDANTVGRASLR